MRVKRLASESGRQRSRCTCDTSRREDCRRPVCALTCLEPCWGFDIYRNRENKQLDLVQGSRRSKVSAARQLPPWVADWGRARQLMDTQRQIFHPHQVVSRRCEREYPTHLLKAPMPYFPHQRYRLQPSTAFSDPFPLLVANAVSAMPRRPLGDRAASAPLRVSAPRAASHHLPALRHEVSACRNPYPRRP